MKVSIAVFIIAAFSFIGWFFFVIFGGVGLSALPMDFIHSFTRRPTWKDPKERIKTKKILQNKAEKYLELAHEIE